MNGTKSRILPVVASLTLFGTASLAIAQEPETKPAADLVDTVVKSKDRQAFYSAYGQLDQRLRKGGAEGTEAARLALGRTKEIVTEPTVRKLIEHLADQKKPELAALLLLQIAKAEQTVRSYKKGHVAVGRVVVEDAKQDPELVLAQMEILPEGYFAGEVGDLERPICFRAPGYADLEVPLKGKTGDLVDLGTIHLKPLPKDQARTLKGKLALDATGDMKSSTVQLSMSVGKANTPHNGYSPRHRWPEPVKVPVSKTGEFSVEGLSPADYYLSVEAPGHADFSRQVKLDTGGLETDLGTIHLRSSDLGFYIGKPAPKTGELAWEKDYPSALKKAQAEKKPVMVMMTATWCGPCKMLEKETLNDPWVRHFLSRFVIVKAYEDKDVEKTYGLNGYPTLVFTDSNGKESVRTVGHQPTLSFAGVCAKAYQKLEQPLPDELQVLVEKKVVTPARD